MYSFETRTSAINKSVKNALIVFSGQSEGDEFDYSYLFETIFREKNKPDLVCFLYPSFLKDQIAKYISNKKTRFIENLMRFGNDTPVIILNYDSFSTFRFDKIYNRNLLGKKDINYSLLREDVINIGLNGLVKKNKNEIILTAPAGTVFQKPSKENYNEFIKASGLAGSYSVQQFIAFASLSKRPDINIKYIYIDTASIAIFAETIVNMLYHYKPRIKVKYLSFGSYSNKNENRPDSLDDIWVIISASTSNNLAKMIINEWSLDKQQVLNILSYKEITNQPGDRSLLNIRKYSNNTKYLNNDSSIKIEIRGENFTAEVSEPERILIKTSHMPKTLNTLVKPNFSTDAFVCNKAIRLKALPVYINIKYYLENDKKLKEWVERVLMWHAPAKTKYLAYDFNDEQSKALVYEIRVILNKSQILQNIDDVDVNSLAKTDAGDSSIIIVSSVISSGRSLLKINRDLRFAGHTGNRMYIAPIVTSKSKDAFDDFLATLKWGAHGFKYSFYSYITTTIGNEGLKNPWNLERELLTRLDHKEWRIREKELSDLQNGLTGNIYFVPSLFSSDFTFSRDFAFWSWNYKDKNPRQSAAYLTISCILQNLRDTDPVNNRKNSLKSFVYQHAVLDPENFSRFNDPLLQACLWRASNPNELDYSKSEDMSECMFSIMSKSMAEYKDRTSPIFLDYLIAIAIRKISLSNNQKARLLVETKKEFRGNSLIKTLHEYISNHI